MLSNQKQIFEYNTLYNGLVTYKVFFNLTLYCIMLKNGQTYFKNLAVFTPHNFKSMFGHFSTLCNKGLMLPHFILMWSH